MRRRQARGFTLIELLVVIVILGSLVGLAVLSTGGAGSTRELADESRRLSALIGLLAEQAVLDNREYGLAIDEQGYRVLRYDEPDAAWVAGGTRDDRRLPDWMRLDLQLDGTPLRLPQRAAADAARQPQLLILSSGELSPFSLRLADRRPAGNAWRLDSDGFRLPEARPADPRP